jgi:hypothetical protein
VLRDLAGVDESELQRLAHAGVIARG